MENGATVAQSGGSEPGILDALKSCPREPSAFGSPSPLGPGVWHKAKGPMSVLCAWTPSQVLFVTSGARLGVPASFSIVHSLGGARHGGGGGERPLSGEGQQGLRESQLRWRADL